MHQTRPLATLLIPLLAITLGGCGSDGAPAADEGGSLTRDSTEIVGGGTEAPANAAGAGGSGEAWNASVTNVGAGLVLSGEGVELIRMACVRESREMTVDIPSFRSIASEERLSFGLDDEPYAFVAQVTPPPPTGVHATRPIEEDFLSAFQAAREVSAVYGSQPIGPYAAPDAAQLEVFLGACRQAMAG